jgi:hypothetical protein
VDIGYAAYSAKITINGSLAGYTAFKPMRVSFDSGLIPKSGKFILEIEVANTAANRIVSYPDFDKWPKEELGGNYHKITIEAEKESLDGGLYGPVVLMCSKPTPSTP